MNQKEIKNYEEKKVKFLNDVETHKFNTNSGDISISKVKTAYKSIVPEKEKGYYHVLVAEKQLAGANVQTKAAIQKFAPSNWESDTDANGNVIRKGMRAVLESAGSIIIVLWSPESDTEETVVIND